MYCTAVLEVTYAMAVAAVVPPVVHLQIEDEENKERRLNWPK
jgi:hypothetical protein